MIALAVHLDCANRTNEWNGIDGLFDWNCTIDTRTPFAMGAMGWAIYSCFGVNHGAMKEALQGKWKLYMGAMPLVHRSLNRK